MSDNPSPDDIFRYLKKMIEDLAGEMGKGQSPHFVGYTIISTPGEAPRVVRITSHSPCEFPCEQVEGPEHYYLTLELPPDAGGEPHVDFDLQKVIVHLGEQEMIIDLPARIDPSSCTCGFRRGTLDIVCKKA
jgi:hypothetical protein